MLLGLAATASHTVVVWAIALIGLYFGSQYNTETSEPYFQLASAVLIVGVALWMLWQTWRDQQHTHDHHHDDVRLIDTGHGVLSLEVFEQDGPPRWRIEALTGDSISPGDVRLTTIRPDGREQQFALLANSNVLESTDAIPEPHAFRARLTFEHNGHSHVHEEEFEEHDHAHDRDLDMSSPDYQDAHQRAHARDIETRFASREVTTGQIIMFGLTGGLIPCPASITILLLCLQLKQVSLGIVLVLCFSIGLAITMVGVGAAAAWSVHHVTQRWSGFGDLARRAPYLSSALIICVGVYTGYIGWTQLMASKSLL